MCEVGYFQIFTKCVRKGISDIYQMCEVAYFEIFTKFERYDVFRRLPNE